MKYIYLILIIVLVGCQKQTILIENKVTAMEAVNHYLIIEKASLITVSNAMLDIALFENNAAFIRNNCPTITQVGNVYVENFGITNCETQSGDMVRGVCQTFATGNYTEIGTQLVIGLSELYAINDYDIDGSVSLELLNNFDNGNDIIYTYEIVEINLSVRDLQNVVSTMTAGTSGNFYYTDTNKDNTASSFNLLGLGNDFSTVDGNQLITTDGETFRSEITTPLKVDMGNCNMDISPTEGVVDIYNSSDVKVAIIEFGFGTTCGEKIRVTDLENGTIEIIDSPL